MLSPMAVPTGSCAVADDAPGPELPVASLSAALRSCLSRAPNRRGRQPLAAALARCNSPSGLGAPCEERPNSGAASHTQHSRGRGQSCRLHITLPPMSLAERLFTGQDAATIERGCYNYGAGNARASTWRRRRPCGSPRRCKPSPTACASAASSPKWCSLPSCAS